jgi:hypothetical protein
MYRCISAYPFITVLSLLLPCIIILFLHLLSTNHKCTQPCYFPLLLKPATRNERMDWNSSTRSSRLRVAPVVVPVVLWSLLLFRSAESRHSRDIWLSVNTFGRMCGTIDPGSCIRWVHGFGIKTGYDKKSPRIIARRCVKCNGVTILKTKPLGKKKTSWSQIPWISFPICPNLGGEIHPKGVRFVTPWFSKNLKFAKLNAIHQNSDR